MGINWYPTFPGLPPITLITLSDNFVMSGSVPKTDIAIFGKI